MFSPHALIAIATEVALFSIRGERLDVLLVARDGARGLPGGYAAVHEDLDAAARRHLEEQTGIRGVYLEQLYTFGRPDRDPQQRVVAVAYYALAPANQFHPQPMVSHPRLDWAPAHDLPPLVLDHGDVVRMAHRRLASKLAYSTIALQFMPKRFTLSDLQKVYETILGEPLDKRNFRKRILAQHGIEATGELFREGNHRPARLYRVKQPGAVQFLK